MRMMKLNSKNVLQAHNAYRRRHCAPPLQLDASLNQRAQDYAQQLSNTNRFEHSKNRNNIGENLYMNYGSAPNSK
jgi:uncharacterized protein YkwD